MRVPDHLERFSDDELDARLDWLEVFAARSNPMAYRDRLARVLARLDPLPRKIVASAVTGEVVEDAPPERSKPR